MNIGIIGTAGRDSGNMSAALFHAMCRKTIAVVKEATAPVCWPIRLHSGGAAWSDHIAVLAFGHQIADELTLYFPCEWDHARSQFKDNGDPNWRRNPGWVANRFHRTFSARMGWTGPGSLTSLQQIGAVIRNGARVEVHPGGDKTGETRGFHDRNYALANSGLDMLLAFTWGPGEEPADGGTRHTWNQAGLAGVSDRRHFSLEKLLDAVVEGIGNAGRTRSGAS